MFFGMEGAPATSSIGLLLCLESANYQHSHHMEETRISIGLFVVIMHMQDMQVSVSGNFGMINPQRMLFEQRNLYAQRKVTRTRARNNVRGSEQKQELVVWQR